MPICPKCQKLISERHYERHLRRCGTEHEHEPELQPGQSVTAQLEGRERESESAPPGSDEGKRNWKKVILAGFVISLLIGSLVVFFVLYLLSFL